MTAESQAILTQCVESSAIELFESYGVALRLGDPEPKELEIQYAASLGYTHPQIKGALVIATVESILTESMPTLGTTTSNSKKMYMDWNGELSNQLLGRIKRKLLACSYDIQLSTPVIFRGDKVQLAPMPGIPAFRFLLEGAQGFVIVVFQSKCSESFNLDDRALTGAQEIKEGDHIIF